jgi:hypothetical protein
MRASRGLLAGFTCVLLGCAYPLGAQTSSGCRPADATSAEGLQRITELVTSTDSVDMAYRTRLNIPATSASIVSLATDTRTCQKGADGFNAWLTNTPPAPRLVWTYKIADAFAVEDPTYGTEGEYRTLLIFNKRWQYQGTMLTF